MQPCIAWVWLNFILTNQRQNKYLCHERTTCSNRQRPRQLWSLLFFNLTAIDLHVRENRHCSGVMKAHCATPCHVQMFVLSRGEFSGAWFVPGHSCAFECRANNALSNDTQLEDMGIFDSTRSASFLGSRNWLFWLEQVHPILAPTDIHWLNYVVAVGFKIF